MKKIVFYLEERSAKEFIKGIWEKLPHSDQLHPEYIVFEGKSDLEKRLSRKLKAYLDSSAVFIVLRDKDSGDCNAIRTSLSEKCTQARRGERCVVRIAIHELESWFLADLSAVERAFGIKGLSTKQKKEKFRNPDTITSPYRELRQLLPDFQKVSGARAIAPYMDLANQRSASFAAFIRGYQRMAELALTDGGQE